MTARRGPSYWLQGSIHRVGELAWMRHACIAGTGIGILVWLAPVATDDLTRAQDTLLNIGDWMVKTAIGAMLGFSGARLVSRGSGDSA